MHLDRAIEVVAVDEVVAVVEADGVAVVVAVEVVADKVQLGSRLTLQLCLHNIEVVAACRTFGNIEADLASLGSILWPVMTLGQAR